MVDSVTTTLLVLSGASIPAFASRGLRQSIEPIAEAGKLEETVNGTTINLAPAQFRKYKTEISGSDQQPPGFGALWPGDLVTIESIVSFASLAGGQISDRVIVATYDDGDATLYRIRLDCIVESWSLDFDEYAAKYTWKLAARERQAPAAA